MYANQSGERVAATPAQKASCPSCDGNVISKCGDIKIWHWAHEVSDCDPWSEGETLWHREWKERFPEDCREVTMHHYIHGHGEKGFGVLGQENCHRADIKTDTHVVEFQHSSISGDEIRERETFYHLCKGYEMAWVIDVLEYHENIELRYRYSNKTASFRWKWPRKSWWASEHADIYLDNHNGLLFQVQGLYPNCPCGGWGKWVRPEQFLKNVGVDQWKWIENEWRRQPI